MKSYVSTIVENENKFLLVKEAKKHCYVKWSLPSGHVEEDEYIESAAVREVKEETNLDVELNGLVTIYNNFFDGAFSVAYIFTSKIKNNNEIIFDKNELLEVSWFTYEEIKNMADDLRDKDYTITSIERYNAKQIKPLDTIINR